MVGGSLEEGEAPVEVVMGTRSWKWIGAGALALALGCGEDTSQDAAPAAGTAAQAGAAAAAPVAGNPGLPLAGTPAAPGDPTAGAGAAPAAGAGPAAGAAAPGGPVTPAGPGTAGTTADPGPSDADLQAAMDPTTPLSDIPASCRGFEVLGLTHSPGGSVLPNTCAPFDNLFNNPYAIRCIDADPAYDTGWPGDEWCILPPEPGLGIQVGVNPADYENPDPGFILAPGEEITNNYYANSENDEAHYYYRVNLRMRSGSHHIINSVLPNDRSDGWTRESDTGLSNESFLGAQRPDADRPTSTLEVPPENAGLGAQLAAHQQFQFNMHHFNFGTEPMLREVWANVWWKDASEVTQSIQGIGIFGNPRDLNIAPGEHRELHYRCDVGGDTRILTLNGHRHTHTDRFGVWIERAGGATESVYESFDYDDMPTYQYDSLAENPVPNVEQKIDGASTGILEVSAGDSIHFVCDITNRYTETLRFANEVQSGEMCILFGSRVGSPLCGQGTRVP